MNTAAPGAKPASGETTLKIAVTGSAGSGKSTVCERLKQLNVQVVSSDVLAKEAVAPGTAALKKITEHFGAAAINTDGSLNRRRIRQIIVNDEGARKKLEAFVHPEIIKRIHDYLTAAENEKRPAIVVEVPLLFELSLENRFDVILLVVAGREQQIERLVKRDHVTRADAEALLRVQMPAKHKIQKSDYVIHNDDSMEKMLSAVDSFYTAFFKKG
jgi:dephospho-CoA kinase